MTDLVRVAAVGDIHCTKSSSGALAPLFAQMADSADVIALCGDLVDYGLPEETRMLVSELSHVLRANVPVVAVLGNHDFESGQPEAVKQGLCEAGVHVLDGDGVEIKGIGFAGVKGFGGGFGQRMLSPWGESAIKEFVHEAVEEGLRLERALQRLTTRQRIVLLHYAPTMSTLDGEPRTIWTYLGSERLATPIAEYPPDLVLHSHAHAGSFEGAIGDTPVYNVAVHVTRKDFYVFELEATPGRSEVEVDAPPA